MKNTSLAKDLGDFKLTEFEINANSATILSNASSAYSIFVSCRAIAILQIQNVVNVYTAYNNGNAFYVAPVIINYDANPVYLGTNSSGQLAIWNYNKDVALRCTLIYK